MVGFVCFRSEKKRKRKTIPTYRVVEVVEQAAILHELCHNVDGLIVRTYGVQLYSMKVGESEVFSRKNEKNKTKTVKTHTHTHTQTYTHTHLNQLGVPQALHDLGLLEKVGRRHGSGLQRLDSNLNKANVLF